MRRGLVAIALWVGGFAGGSCGRPADNPYSALHTFTSPSGGYAIRYMKPPWRISDSTDTEATLRVPSNAEVGLGDNLDGGIDKYVPPKYVLQVSVVQGDPQSLAISDENTVASRNETLITSTRSIETRAHVVGYEMVCHVTVGGILRYRRYVYLPHAPFNTLRLVFEGNPNVDNREVTEMIRAVELVEPGAT